MGAVFQIRRESRTVSWLFCVVVLLTLKRIFNDAIYNGDLQTATGSMLIADYFSPEKSTKRIASLTHAAKISRDDRLLAEINHFKMTKLG